MLLLDRIQQYKNLEKGPKRTFKKTIVNESILYSCPNGICIFKTVENVPLKANDFKLVELGEDFTIVQLKSFEKYEE